MFRLLIQVVWFVVIAVVLMFVVSFGLSVLAPAANQQAAGRALFGPIMLVALVLTAIGAKKGLLPGTKRRPEQ